MAGKENMKIKIELNLVLDEDMIRRLDAAAKWNGTTPVKMLQGLIEAGLFCHIKDRLKYHERLMDKYPTIEDAEKAYRKERESL